jgi:spore coat protein U-like protein
MSFGSRAILFALACVAGAVPAHAATCDISPQSVSFGAYDPTEPSDLDGVGTITIACDAEVSVTISLSSGAGSYGVRAMPGGTGQLSYNLYTTSQRVIVWGDGSGGSDSVSDTLQSRDFTVYGTIPARQTVSAGTYADTIVVTITY